VNGRSAPTRGRQRAVVFTFLAVAALGLMTLPGLAGAAPARGPVAVPLLPSGNSTGAPGPDGASFAWSSAGFLVLVEDSSAVPNGNLGLSGTFDSFELLWGDGSSLVLGATYLPDGWYAHLYSAPGAYNITEEFTYTLPTIFFVPGQNATATYVSVAYAVVQVGVPGGPFP
jgi:hypothetical protein